MNILIKSATIIDSKSEFHNSTQDILIENGVITSIAKSIKNTNKYQEIQLDNLHISQGWFDSSVSFGEPGFEERDTIENGLKTAAASGFTAVAMNANSNPVIDSNSNITFVNAKAQNHAVSLLPIGALTVGSKGEDLAELYDMKSAGAVAFYDYKKPISNPNLMKIALQYASNFDGLICAFPQENKIAGHGVMNENITSTTLGLKGIPAMAEELQIARDIFLLEYTGGKLHIPTISTAKSVELVREAKQKKLNITCSVAIHNLYFSDATLSDFNTHFKVLPPLRIQSDIDALIEGIKDGTIDMVTSDHNPIDVEHKKIEFDHAKNGTIGLESAFGALQSIFTIKKTIDLLTKGKSRFGLENTPINIGNKADLSLFNPDTKYTFSKNDIISKSKNAIFEGEALKGKVYGIISNNKVSINS
ncbi:dihydroorotase [Algibacter lectus]|uniref:Dihydroorotase n=1 Tax=Algibacter lectus TaxID=221126 RepID=A0A4R8MHB6_9FLAO|nr:dihydroorotase [Algibacter lectus]MWW25148.1 amidohydrolase family protein [Algibacter lectus]TDY64438.1 dihydroorotase [Algibacter lectus]SFD48736.1 dihydroorotase [Algibacter lectus]